MPYKHLLLFFIISLCFAEPRTLQHKNHIIQYSETKLVVGEVLTVRIRTEPKNIEKITIHCAEEELLLTPIEPGYWQARYIPAQPGIFTLRTQLTLSKDAVPIITEQTIFVHKDLSPQKIQYKLIPIPKKLGERVQIQVFLPKPVQNVLVLIGKAQVRLTETGLGLWEGAFTVTTPSAGIFIDDTGATIYKPLGLNIAQTENSIATANQIQDSLSIKGNKSIAYISRTKQGTIENFAEETRREESLNLLVTGRQGEVSIDAQVFSTTAESVDKKDDMRLRFYTPTWETYLGDYSATLSENSLTLKDKTLRGLRFTYTPTNDHYSVFTAQASGQEQIEYLYGNDSQGPFYCSQAPVIPGSEKLIVDNTLYLRDKDYTIDYRSGKIIYKNIFRKGQLATLRYEASNIDHTGISGLNYAHQNTGYGFGATYLQAKSELDSFSTQNAVFKNKLLALQASTTINQLQLHGEQAWGQYEQEGQSTKRSAARAGSLEYNTTQLQSRISSTQTDMEFIPIGNNNLAPGLSRTSLNAEYQPVTGNILRTEQLSEHYNQSSMQNKYRYYKFYHHEDTWPEMRLINKYNLQENTTSINRLSKVLDHSRLELVKSVSSIFKAGLTGLNEKEEDSLQLEGRYRTKKGGGGFLQTNNIPGLEALIGTEQSQQAYYDHPEQVSQNSEYIENYAKIHFYPNSFYQLGLQTRQIKDTVAGPSEITDIDLDLNPDPSLRAQGQYTVQSLVENYASENFQVQKQKGSFLGRWQPLSAFRTIFKYTPVRHIIKAETPILAAQNDLKNLICDISPTYWLSSKYSYTEQYSQSKDLSRLQENILQQESTGLHQGLLLKFSPLEKLDIELKHRNTKLFETQRDTTTNNVYFKGRGQEYENGLIFFTRPTRELTLETAYINEYRDLLYDTATSLDYKLVAETYRLDSKYRFLYFWTFRFFGSFHSMTDLLKPTDNITHEYTPGIGLGYRNAEFGISYDYSRTESTRGEDILSHTYIFNLQYDYSQYIQGSIARTQLVSERPRYITNEVIAKFSATF